ncbi:MAG: threonine dehydratase [Bacillota bacterium]|nr:MAG: threonine dehydratase [Bacillota bacterium]MBS3950420.1 pyridoxal-phosphate dependent enzyme [Peptococcaceae bacterium]
MVMLKDSLQARERIRGVTHYTPLMYSKTLSEMSGNEVYLKCENFQKTGSFKIRGAYNAVSHLSDEQKARGVVTGSSGNHGQALAYAASLQGVRCVVVMPEDASLAKIAACKGYGGEVLLHGVTSEARLDRAQELVENEGLIMVHPFDNPHIIAGQGTISLEIMEQLPGVEYILAPVGGGGLLSGVAMAAKEVCPSLKVLGVEPAVGPRLRYSWDRGTVSELERWSPSVADGLRARRPGKLPFEVTRKYVDDLIQVEEQEIIDATKLIMERVKLVVEPSGAVTAAAVLARKLGAQGQNVVCVVSGGNVELAKLAKIIG